MNLYAIDWYGVHLPRTRKELIQKGINSLEFIKAITGKRDITISLSESNMPYYDTRNKQVYIPRLMFSDKYFTKELGINPDFVQQNFIPVFLTIYNGFQIHESLHITRSPNKSFDKWIGYKTIQYPPFTLDFIELIVARCINLVEDLYIENGCKLDYPNMYPFLEDTCSLIFNDDMFTVISEQLSEITSEMPLEQQVKTIYGYLTFYKNAFQREKMSNLTPNYTDIMNLVLGNENYLPEATRTETGIQLALEILKNLKIENKSDDEIKQECQATTGNNEGEGNNGLEGNEINSFDNAKNAFKELINSLSKSELDEIADVKQKMDDYFKIIRQKSENIRPPVIYTNVMDLPESKHKLKNMTEWATFARMLNRFIVNRNKPILARKEGVEVIEDNLYRVATDQYVFGKPKPKTKRKKTPEIVILVDVSGSVEYMLPKIIDNVYGLCNALKGVNIPFSVYTHTTGHSQGKDSCMIYGVAASGMELYDKKFNNSLANSFNRVMSIDCNGNYDGYAIEWAVQRFSNDDSPKLFLYFSDGQPNSYHYSHDDAIKHTKEQADKARAKGIHTWVISLDKRVVRDNDNIYGKQYNVDASDLTKLAVNLQTLVGNLLIGKGKT